MFKYRLIPATALTTPSATPVANQPPPMALSTIPPTSQVAVTLTPIIGKIENQNKNLEEIVNLFPARLQNKARLMLTHIWNRIGLTEDSHVLYKEEDHDRRGSSVYDLVRFFITPSPPRTGNQTRPPDAFEFGKLLSDAGTPLAAYGFGKSDFVSRIETSQTARDSARLEVPEQSGAEKEMNGGRLGAKRPAHKKRTNNDNAGQTKGKWHKLK